MNGICCKILFVQLIGASIIFLNTYLEYKFSKVVVIILALVLIGGGTVLAAGFYVKSYPHKTKIMTEEKAYTELGIYLNVYKMK